MSRNSVWFTTLSDAKRAEMISFSRPEIDSRPDVLIVGGGIVGLAAAYSLVQHGLRVEVIEAETLASQASGANAGGIWPDQQGIDYPPAFRDLARRSRDLWGKLPARDGFDFDWRVNGFLTVDSRHWDGSPEELANQLLSEGLSAHAIDGEQVRMLEPNLKSGINGGVHYPSEAHVHPVKAALSFARAAVGSGATIVQHARAVTMRVENDRVVDVETTAGQIHPGAVVAATGWTADWFAEFAPSPPPLVPLSGQLIATAPQPPLISGTVLGQAIVVQLRSGEIVTGGNVVDGQLAEADPDVTAEFAAAAQDLIPALEGVPFEQAWTGARPATPDHLPIIDRLPGIENLWVAAGHFKNGLLLAPITGESITEWITDGSPSIAMEAFRWNRFE